MAKQTNVTFWVYADRIEGECETCGFDALLRIRAYHVTVSGVGTVIDQTDCGRCLADKQREAS